MNQSERTALLALPVIVAIGVGMAAAGSQGGTAVFGFPLFALLVGLAFLIQWAVFIPSFWLRTEKAFDLTGSVTYVSVTTLAVVLSPAIDARSILLLAVVSIWAARLGSFLFVRIHRAGKDERFDAIKTSLLRFLMTWTLQGLWVTLTLAPALAAITTATRRAAGPMAIAGAAVWAFGFAIEVIADAQKRRFRANPAHQGAFISSGLWARSRHPNYFGEIVLWIGVALIAAPVLRGWQWVTLVSPVFVMLLLTRVSGVPLLERSADERWGGREDYEAYKARTPVLIPRLRSAPRPLEMTRE